MTDNALLRRLARTVRVAAHTALAEYELNRTGSAGRVVTFQALAAKTADAWRFPEAGLVGADGLVLATLDRADDGSPLALRLQALGAAGLAAYPGRTVAVAVDDLAPGIPVTFDADGRTGLTLADHGLEEADLAGFALTVPEGP